MVTKFFIIFLFLFTANSLRLFLIGGNTNEKDVLVYQQLAASISGRPPQTKCDQNWDTTKCPRIAVATSAASNSSDGNDAYSNDTESMGYYTMFNLFGMSPKHLSIHRDNYKTDGNPDTAQGAANLAILKQADIIYFNGGDQSRHLRAWLNDDGSENKLLSVIKERAFNNEVVLAGTSAGSMIWGPWTAGGGSSFGILYFKNSVGLAPKKVTDGAVGGTGFFDTRNGTHGLQYEENGGKMNAFGWIDWHADTHFSARGRLGRLPALLVDTHQSLGIGIDEKTAFFFENGVGTVYGYNGATVCDMSNALIKPQTYFTAVGIRSHYLTPKDSYNFKEKSVISSKTLIKSPAYSGPTDSSDILKSY